MKIAIDARYLSSLYSGIGVYSENLVLQLSRIDTTNQYLVIVHPTYAKSLKLGDNFRVITYHARPVSLKTLLMLPRILVQEEVDLLHSLFPLAPLFFEGNLLVTVHDLQPLLVPEFTGKRPIPIRKAYDYFYRWIYPRTLRKAKWIVAVSEATKAYITNLFPDLKHKTIVVHSGIERDFITGVEPFAVRKTVEKYAIPEKYLLYVGSTRPNKNLPQMIRAFAQLVKSDSQFEDLIFLMVLQRDRFFKDCERLIDKLQLRQRVKILENLTEEEKKVVVAYASLLFFATKYEGFGFPILEAQALGTPVLASDCSALPEIAGSAAVLVDPDKPDKMAEGIRKILSDDAFRTTLIKKGKTNVLRFSWEKTARQILDIYTHLC
jgi:glycosyltransferase involved in cell wall biosynthesis